LDASVRKKVETKNVRRGPRKPIEGDEMGYIKTNNKMATAAH
jgi:hypothetical protein